ncbi:hypothetical protein G6011_09051 [Alternaria panax]|uniref:J domain-containing protein n=1 Tax=Alternaria panax TaxID=48097 RepID=A0AAD4IAH6_9PLEO|nr:hypothetical protein G6011_09051 [Alternaria panax]
MGDNNKALEDLAKSTTDDFYELLGVAFDASEATIRKAYRQASIRYHPDKNPDDKDAADRFIRLGWARDILIDEKLKGEYDRVRTRRREKALQDELLDGRRRKMKEDLERREREAPNSKRKRTEEMIELERIEQDGRRLRKKFMERREEERKKLDETSFTAIDKSPRPQAPEPAESAEIDRTVKIQFQRKGETIAWDKDKMSSMFAKYGKIDIIVTGKDRNIRPSGEKHRKTFSTFFITYTLHDYAHAAVFNGKRDYPWLESISWVIRPSSPVSTPASTPRNKSRRPSFGSDIGKGIGSTRFGTPRFSFSPKTPSLEEVTMIKLKQAEKKRLEEQIRKQEAAEEAEEAAEEAEEAAL